MVDKVNNSFVVLTKGEIVDFIEFTFCNRTNIPYENICSIAHINILYLYNIPWFQLLAKIAFIIHYLAWTV